MTKNDKDSKKYEPTSSGYREVEAGKDQAAMTEGVTPEKKLAGTQPEAGSKKTAETKADKKSNANLALETNFHIPYPDKGGHTVSQLYQMETHKRKAILGDKDDEFVNEYM